VGADLSERNLLGSGLSFGAGLVYASHDEVEQSRDQWAGEARLALPSIAGSPWSAFGSATVVSGSEAYQVRGADQDTAAASFRAFHYRRTTARVGGLYDLSSLARLSVTARAEFLDADLPETPTRTLPDGRTVTVDLSLDRGRSRVITATVALDRDNRPDPVLPHAGSRLTLSAEIGGTVIGSSYDFAALLARYERWWPLRSARHAVGVRLGGGAILGDAPRFDQLQLADFNRMLSPRALGLLVSLNAPLDILQTASDKPTLGELGGSATVEYTYRLFGRSAGRIYGGDLFLGAGLWGLAATASPRIRDRALWSSLPIDAFIDAGLRIDTDIGVFELTVANALGRVPR
jgi:outer membrane protein assembly factor BamA